MVRDACLVPCILIWPECADVLLCPEAGSLGRDISDPYEDCRLQYNRYTALIGMMSYHGSSIRKCRMTFQHTAGACIMHWGWRRACWRASGGMYWMQVWAYGPARPLNTRLYTPPDWMPAVPPCLGGTAEVPASFGQLRSSRSNGVRRKALTKGANSAGQGAGTGAEDHVVIALLRPCYQLPSLWGRVWLAHLWLAACICMARDAC